MSSIVEQAINAVSKGGTDYGLYEKRNSDGSYSSTDRVGQVVQQATADYQSGAKTAPKSNLESNADSFILKFRERSPYVYFGTQQYDKEAFNLAAEAQRNWWENTGSKGKQYGYDMTDPEDVLRAQEGRYSKKYEASYGDDEYSQWLLANGQASSGFFESKYYKEAYNSVMLERAKQEGVRNFNQAVVKELLATAADAENPTAEEIALAADRVKKTNPSFTNIGIADFGEGEADGNFATLHLDDVQDEYMAMWGKKRFQESVDQRRRTEQRNARIEAAVAASGYDATMGNATGLAYDSKRKQYDANQKKKVAATDAIVAELRAEGLAPEEIRQYLAEDGRLSYDESTEKATIDAQTKAEKAAMDNSVLGSIFSDTRRGSRMSKAEESTTGYIPATALDVTTSLLQKAKDAANNRKVWENSPIAQSAEWVAANTLSEEELTEVKNIMANAREAFIFQGYSPFEIDNFFRRNDLGEYLDPVAASNNYMTYTLGEWGYSDIEIQAVIDGLTDEDYETISKDMFLCDYVDTSTTDQIGYTMAAIPAIAAYRMVGDAVGFFDMVTAGNREELWGATQWLNDRAAYWTAIGTNGNHEFLSKTAEYGSEIVRLLAMQGVGQLAGAAVTGISAASKGTAWLTKAVWATESVPFVASAMGGYYTEAKGQGASTADATKYAVVAGAVEGLLEKLSMGEFVKGHFGSNLIGKKLMNGNTSGMVKQLFSRYGAQLADVLASSVGEGLEEGASYVASSLMRQATWDEDYAMTGQEFGQNFLGGLIIGGILGGLSAPADSQRYKYAMDIYNRTGSYTMNMDSLYAASYYETLPEGQRLALKEKFDNGEIVADNSTRKAAIQAEGELANMDKEIAAKHKALESAKADGENKTNLAQEKIANIDQRIAAYQDADLVKKARKITELLQQRQTAEKAYKTVLSETEKKTQQAEADYIAIKSKRTEKSVALTETIANYQTAKYFTDFYGIPQKPAQNAPAGGQVAMPITNTTDTANVAQNPINTVKMDAAGVVDVEQLQETTEVDVESADLGYLEAVDSRIVEMVEAVRRNDTKYMPPLIIGDVTPDLASEVNRITGIDVSGFKHGLQRDGIEHIEKRHGENGEADSSMANTEDIARIQYILDNFDSVDIARKQNGKPVYSKKYKNKDGSPAPVLEFVKKVDGHYYVSEAIPDAAAQTLWITSARIVPNKKGAYQVPDASALTPGLRPNAELGFTPDNSIPNSAENSNPQLKDLGANTPTPVEMKTRKSYSNTFDKAMSAVSNAVSKVSGTYYNEGSYAVSKEKDTLAYAQEAVRGELENAGTLAGLETRLSSREAWTAEDVDTAMIMAEVYEQEALETGDFTRLENLKRIIGEHLTEAGQVVQAMAKWSRTTNAGASAWVERTINKLNEKNADKIASGKATKITIPDDLKAKLAAAKTKEERDSILAETSAVIGQQIPTDVKSMLDALRYMSMLGNARTHIRNIFGNTIMRGVIQAKNVVGAGIESVAISDQSKRTKAVLSNSESDTALKEYANSTWDFVKHEFDGSKYSDGEKGFAKAVEDSRTIFKWSALEKLRKLNDAGLALEDSRAAKKLYTRTFAQAMKARGLTAETITEAQKKEIAGMAINEAIKGTFHDANQFAKTLSKWENGSIFGKVFIGGTLPFKNTPINIAKRGVEYSPIGLIKGVFGDLPKVKKGEMSAAQAIDGIASGFVGTSLFAIGAFLAKAGILRGEGEDSDKEEYYRRDLGDQPYALYFGNKSYTIDWLSPAAMPLFMGVEFQKILSGESDSDNVFDAVLDFASQITNPLLQLSFLEGVNDTLTAAQESEYGMIVGAIANAPGNYLSQFIPTLSGQIARTIDPVRRNTKGDPTAEMGQEVDEYLNKIKAKIPFLSSTLPAYVNAWGDEEVDDSHWAMRLIKNAISPGYSDERNYSGADEEILRLFEATNNESILPNYYYTYRDLTRKGEIHTLTNEEWTEFRKDWGAALYEAAEDAMRSNSYIAMTDDEKADYIAKAMKSARDDIANKYKDKYLGK